MKTLNFPSKDRVFKDLFARNPEQNLKKALEIYQRLLSHMDDRPAGARAATVCAISAGLERLTAETPQISVQRQAPHIDAHVQ